ncbi:MAG: hypothetical protein FJW34_24310, partial [Acidobacteria bacterium]|nr:hypothetical protein [Acidobacteriota bacterium]
TDCNQRDERLGWMADAHLYAESAMLNYDAAAFFANFLRDIRDTQGADGSLTDTVPHRRGRRPADPAWGAAYPLIAWYLYLHHGDRRILQEHYPGIKAWTDFQRANSEDGILSYTHYGDWVPVEKTPNALVSTFYYYYSAYLTSRMAEILAMTADAEAYRKLAAGIQEAFNRRFWNADNGYYGNGSQTSQILPLYLDLAAKERRGPAMGHLRSSVLYYNNTHLMTGILGAKYAMELLCRAGNLDLACDDSVGRAPPPAHRPPGRCLAHLGVGLRLRAATPPVWLRLCRAVGAVAGKDRAVHELPQSPHVREHRRLVLQRPGGHQLRPGETRLRAHTHSAGGSARLALGLRHAPDPARHGALLLEPHRAVIPPAGRHPGGQRGGDPPAQAEPRRRGGERRPARRLEGERLPAGQPRPQRRAPDPRRPHPPGRLGPLRLRPDRGLAQAVLHWGGPPGRGALWAPVFKPA